MDRHRSAHALPCVSKDWKRLYEACLEKKGEEAHRLLMPPTPKPEEATAPEETEKQGFERFIAK